MVCAICPSGFECGKLAAALALLDATPIGDRPGLAARIEAFRDKLAFLEYQYPDSVKACPLWSNRTELRDLTQEAIELLYEAARWTVRPSINLEETGFVAQLARYRRGA